jgi:hypothetical protein
MQHLSRLVLGFSLMILVVLGAFALDSAILDQLGFNVRDWPKHLRLLATESERRDELVRRMKSARLRLQAQDEISQELIAGRITLAQAARLVCELPDAPPILWEKVRSHMPGGTEEERIMRFVIFWSCEVVREEHDRKTMRRRLEKELHDHIHANQSFRSAEIPAVTIQAMKARFAQQ